VLHTYQERCAVCRLPEPALLEAAHIIPDAEEGGQPDVTNGLALCRLHHGAFDADLLGIRPDGTIHISRRLLEALDGPTLDHAVKGFEGQPVAKPPAKRAWPDQERIATRYRRFLAAQ
jgi:putative restriction endonuclease